jgi:hypothetical protein
MEIMEIKKLVYSVLKVIGYVLGFIGAFKLIGAVGALEYDCITLGEFVYHEFIAFVLIFSSYTVYIIRENFKYRFLRRRRTY